MKRMDALLLLLLALNAKGQQVPQYTQYVFNHFSINPAVAGSKDCLDVRLGYRKQWVGFENAPTTSWASLHGVIKQKGKPYQKNRHGIGAFVEADDTGPIGYTQFLLAYALLRMVGEAFREPDAGLILGVSRGTFYSVFMIGGGLALILRRPTPPPEKKI